MPLPGFITLPTFSNTEITPLPRLTIFIKWSSIDSKLLLKPSTILVTKPNFFSNNAKNTITKIMADIIAISGFAFIAALSPV